VFLLPSIALGLAIAVALGGRPSRVLELRFRAQWLVLVALLCQVVLFSRVGDQLPGAAIRVGHVSSYLLLLGFGLANVRVRALWLLLTGMVLNAIAILANGGAMPLSSSAATAAGIDARANVSTDARVLGALGDVFALPSQLPFANAFSAGDVLIGIGMVLLIVRGSLAAPAAPLLSFRRLGRPLGSTDFRRLAAGRLVSVGGDWLTTAALIGWIYNGTHSTAYVALLLLARMAPPVFGGSLAAVVADRVPKRRLLVGVELGRCAVVVAAIAAVVVGTHVGVFVCVALSGGLAALTTSVTPALVPALVESARYPAANALLGVIENAAMAAGALGGGLALSYLGAPTALALDAATFLVAAALFSRIRASGAPPATDDETVERGGLRYLLSRPRLLAVVGCFAAAIIATGLANATLPRLLRDDLAVGPGAYGFGLAAIAIGLTFGQLCVGLVRVGDQGIRWMGTALALMAGLFALLGLVEHALTAFLLLAAIGFVDGSTDGVFDTVVQREADAARHGAVFGVSSATFAISMMAAVLAAPVLNRVGDASVVLTVGAIALLLASAIAFAGSRTATPQRQPAPRAA
jgi:predicted MFS family arabinose efflux permease